jgi:hypothetical protein
VGKTIKKRFRELRNLFSSYRFAHWGRTLPAVFSAKDDKWLIFGYTFGATAFGAKR